MDVFVSYAGPDRAWAEWAAWHLRADGYSVELDVWDWAAGDNVVLRMSDALDRARRVLMLWSPAYFERRRFTTDEWTATVADRGPQRRMIPVRVAEVSPPAVLAALVYRDLFGRDEDAAKATLLDAVRGPRGAGGQPEFPGTAKRKPPRDAAPRLPEELPSLWNVPRRNAAFTGRDAHLVELRQQLMGGRTAVVQALHGFGGIGKTTLAIEYAHRFAGAYDLVWWINAENPALIGEQLTALGVEAGWTAIDAPEAGASVLRRLRAERGWLLVFDNAEDRDDLLPWLPQGAGHILITSRNPSWETAAHPVPLPEFTRTESIELLRRSLPTADRADELAERLGDLPLALAQAGQTIARTGLTVPEYLELLDKETAEILSEGTPAGYPVPLAAVVRTAVQRLTERDPAAATLLVQCAFLGPEPIPTDLFTAGSKLALARSRQSIGEYGLARVGNGTLQLHRLTQAIVRDSTSPAGRVRIRLELEEALLSAGLDDGKDPRQWPRWAALLPHILAVDPAASGDAGFCELACQAGVYLVSIDTRQGACQFAERLHAGYEARLGPDDLRTLQAAAVLTFALLQVDRYAEALAIGQRTYDRRRRLLGDNHPDTLISASDLGGALHGLEQYDESVAIDRDTHERRLQVLGEDHPDTLLSASNVATSLSQLGRRFEALAIEQRTYTKVRRVLGEEHPQTLSSANNLANDLIHIGRFAEALVTAQETYVRCRALLGDDHVDTLDTANNVARALFELGRPAEALPILESTYARSRRVFGDDHSHTLYTVRLLGMVLIRLRRVHEGRKMLERAKAKTAAPKKGGRGRR
ncbi:FxSxx-COOH system tetratricopeptide repeat protein [Dactylosporangium sp. NPDC051485]|uniref:FxSxx-COOH system tetratricopeptide repeat protein n=1 Tax=Dactylosporangium sp. NPDC051485 TaxID=3154846 RepID=UPI0034221EDD